MNEGIDENTLGHISAKTEFRDGIKRLSQMLHNPQTVNASEFKGAIESVHESANQSQNLTRSEINYALMFFDKLNPNLTMGLEGKIDRIMEILKLILKTRESSEATFDNVKNGFNSVASKFPVDELLKEEEADFPNVRSFLNRFAPDTIEEIVEELKVSLITVKRMRKSNAKSGKVIQNQKKIIWN